MRSADCDSPLGWWWWGRRDRENSEVNFGRLSCGERERERERERSSGGQLRSGLSFTMKMVAGNVSRSSRELRLAVS